MGVDTRGFVLTNEKNVHKVWSTIHKSLIDEMMKESGADNQIALFYRHIGYSRPSCEVVDVEGMLIISFQFKGEDRALRLYLDRDSDYEYVKRGKKIIISLGMWGSSLQLIEAVLKGLSIFGKAYILENDMYHDWRPIK